MAFGTGVMDEDDVYGMTDDYVDFESGKRPHHQVAVVSDEDEEGDPLSTRCFLAVVETASHAWWGALVIGGRQCRGRYGEQRFLLPGREQPLGLQSREDEERRRSDLVPGFTKAQQVERRQEFRPPKVPPGYKPTHRFPPEELPGVTSLEEGAAVTH